MIKIKSDLKKIIIDEKNNAEMPYVSTIVLFIFIITTNVLGHYLIEKMNKNSEAVKTTGQLVQQQKVALSQFISAASSSVIGLATSNWKLLLEERKTVSAEIGKFESLNGKIIDSLQNENDQVNLKKSLDALQPSWLELKRLSTVVLRAESRELTNNESLIEFINISKELVANYERFEAEVTQNILLKGSEITSVQRLVEYVNLGFQIISLPLLIFFIFMPFRRKTIELKIARGQQFALSKLSALGEMAAGVAHEINTPLGAIVLNAEMITLENDSLVAPSEEIAKRVLVIIDIGQRISKIISGLKGFSRDASNDSDQTFPVGMLIQNTLELCNERFKNNNVQIMVKERFLETTVRGQIIQLSQTLLNLLNNSFDAIQELAEKQIWIEVEVTGSYLELSVTDSGSGIPEDIVEKIFQPFFTTKDIGKGTGLGLSISAGTIQSHGGSLVYDSKSKNTRFVIRLPVWQEEGKAA